MRKLFVSRGVVTRALATEIWSGTEQLNEPLKSECSYLLLETGRGNLPACSCSSGMDGGTQQ